MCFCTPNIRTPFCSNCNQAMFLRINELRTTITEQAKRIRHVEMALADTEALEMGTAETLGKAKARIKALERELGLAEVTIDEMSSAAIKQFKRIKELEDALRLGRDAFQSYVDEHEECQDADDWMAMMCSIEAHHVTDEAIAKINELLNEV